MGRWKPVEHILNGGELRQKAYIYKKEKGMQYLHWSLSPWGNKTPDKSNLRQENFNLTHSLEIQFIMVGKSWQQEHKEAGYIASTDRKLTHFQISKV